MQNSVTARFLRRIDHRKHKSVRPHFHHLFGVVEVVYGDPYDHRRVARLNRGDMVAQIGQGNFRVLCVDPDEVKAQPSVQLGYNAVGHGYVGADEVFMQSVLQIWFYHGLFSFDCEYTSFILI